MGEGLPRKREPFLLGGAIMTGDANGMTAVVVGAGPAGLAAAWRLVDAGAAVLVRDAARRAGGLLRTEELDGARVDVGVQLVGSPHTVLFELARRANAGDVLQRSPGHDALWRRGRPHGITYGSVSSMVASGALPMTLKLRMASRYVPFLKGAARDLDVNDPAGSGGVAFDDESIGAWGARELGDDFVELLAYPLLAAYYGAEPEETGAGIYHALAHTGMDVSVYGARGGFGALADALRSALEAQGVRFELGSRVQSVTVSGDVVEVDGTRCDAAVVAVQAPRAAALLGADGALAQWLGTVRERSTFTVAYRLDRRFPGDWFGLSLPRTSVPGRRIAAVCAMSRKLPGLVEAGDAIVVMPAPHAVPELLAMDDASLAERLLRDLELVAPGVGARVVGDGGRVFRHDHGYTLFGPGYVRHLTAFDPSWLPPAIALAGDYLVAPSVEGAVRSGVRAADRLLRRAG
jgi:protoporphyrinogen/coproporphyrinogen III oxidase